MMSIKVERENWEEGRGGKKLTNQVLLFLPDCFYPETLCCWLIQELIPTGQRITE